MDAMAASAARQGISVEELQGKMDASIESNRKLAASTKEAGKAMDSAADGTERLANEQARLKTESAEAATAMEKLGKALGIVTAAELETQIVAIEKAMQEASDTTKGFSQELIDMEQEGARRIESLELRAKGLRDGLGDIGKEAADAALGIADFGKKADDAGDQVDDLGAAIDDAGDGMGTLSTRVRDTNSALSDQARQARTTRGELVQLTAVAESLALAQARTELAITKAQRKRITGTRGSREDTDYNLSPFGTGGLFTVEPDGNLRFA
jgi:chromosome segregation ATPase